MKEILNLIFGLTLNSLPYFILCFVPVWDSLRWKKRSIITGMIGLSLANMLSTLLIMTFCENWEFIRTIQSQLILLLYVLLYVLSIRVPISKGVFIALFVKFYADLITSMAKFLENAFWQHTGSYSIHFNLMHLALLCVTFPILWLFLAKKILPAFKIQAPTWRYFWLLPAIFYILNLSFSAMNTQIIKSWQYVSFNIMLFIGAGATILTVLQMLERTKKTTQLEQEVQSMNQLLILQGNQYEQITQNINEVRTIKHDMRHQLIVLNSYAEKGDITHLKEYLEQYIESMPAEAEAMFCENRTVNAVASHYLTIAKSQGVSIDSKLNIPEELDYISGIDLCIVIGNLLNNAVEACQRIKNDKQINRFIHIRAETQNEFLAITVDNSFDGIVRKNDADYLSRKKQSDGLGLNSVKAIAEKHDGAVNYVHENNVFYSSVLIKVQNS